MRVGFVGRGGLLLRVDLDEVGGMGGGRELEGERRADRLRWSGNHINIIISGGRNIYRD